MILGQLGSTREDNVCKPCPYHSDWKLCGQTLCAKAFRSVLGLSRGTFRKWAKSIVEGAVAPLTKPSRVSVSWDASMRLRVRSWLRW